MLEVKKCVGGQGFIHFAFFPPLKAIEALFWKLQCDYSVLEKKLGGSTTAQDENVAIYLGLIEQKTNQLLAMYSFAKAEVCRVDGQDTTTGRRKGWLRDHGERERRRQPFDSLLWAQFPAAITVCKIFY